MSMFSLLGQAASRRHLSLKADRTLVRAIAGLRGPQIAGAGGALLVALVLSPVLILIGLLYALSVVGRALSRKWHRRPTSSGTSVLSRIGSKAYRLISDDDYLGRVEGSFEPEMTAVFTAVIRSGDRVLDVGANIGCTSILFSQLASRVYSFEPSPTTFRFLQQNLSAAGAGNVMAFNYGLGSRTTTETLTFAPNNRSGGFVSNKLHLDEGHQTEVVTIADGDSFLAAQNVERVDFVKIDVEGFELEVLAGLKSVLERCRPVVVLEMNHWCLNAFQRTTVPEFIDALVARFPVLYAINGDELLNLHDAEQRYRVAIEHITQGMKFQNLIGCYDKDRIAALFGAR